MLELQSSGFKLLATTDAVDMLGSKANDRGTISTADYSQQPSRGSEKSLAGQP